MSREQIRRVCLTVVMALALFNATGCTDEFYLSENEAKAYQSVLSTQASANLHFDNLQGRTLDIQFDNSTGTPRLLSSNLLSEMRRTELLQLESGLSAVSLDVCAASWISRLILGRRRMRSTLARTTPGEADGTFVSFGLFSDEPGFTYNPATQSIASMYAWQSPSTVQLRLTRSDGCESIRQ